MGYISAMERTEIKTAKIMSLTTNEELKTAKLYNNNDGTWTIECTEEELFKPYTITLITNETTQKH